MMESEWFSRDVLVTVKAYPNPSKKYGESICVAGVTREEGWIRLYPVLFRELPDPQRFAKYQWVSVNLRKQRSDKRPESYRPDLHSLRPGDVVPSANGWRERRDLLLPTASESMCEIQRLQKECGKSLGMFKPAVVDDFFVEDVEEDWSGRKKEVLGQGMFFSRRGQPLEKIPFTFSYKYRCADPACKGHRQSILDWEIAELYRNVRRTHVDKEEVKALIRRKFFDELCGGKKDTYFFVGNLAKHPQTFLVLGVFWPPMTGTGRTEAGEPLFE